MLSRGSTQGATMAGTKMQNFQNCWQLKKAVPTFLEYYDGFLFYLLR